MVILSLSIVDRKDQNPLELVFYLFPFGPTPNHIVNPIEIAQKVSLIR